MPPRKQFAAAVLLVLAAATGVRAQDRFWDPARTAGDWNTTTHNSSRAFHAIMGYWLRVFLGIDRSIEHYLHPYRWFERELFESLTAHGFEYRESNVLGERTMSYDVSCGKTRDNLGEWIPGWCFAFIRSWWPRRISPILAARSISPSAS